MVFNIYIYSSLFNLQGDTLVPPFLFTRRYVMAEDKVQEILIKLATIDAKIETLTGMKNDLEECKNKNTMLETQLALANQRIESLEKANEEIKDGQKWLKRTIVAALIVSALSIFSKYVKIG